MQKNFPKIISILKRESKKFKNPFIKNDSLFHKSPYRTLISCILSLRTKDPVTAIATRKLFKLADKPQKMVCLTESQIAKAIYPVGFYKKKAKTIIEISKTILEKYNGIVPNTVDELIKLKGVGRKTANIVLGYGYKNPDALAVDVHVHVISNRLGIVKTKNPDKTEFELRKKIPKKYWRDINYLFVLYGQNICLTSSPFCSKCSIKKYCQKIGVKRSR